MKLKMECLFGHQSENEWELGFRQGDILYVDENEEIDSDWRYATRGNQIGLVPHVLLKPMAAYCGIYLYIEEKKRKKSHYQVQIFDFFFLKKKIVRAEALYTFDSDKVDELSFQQGDIIYVESRPKADDDWWYGEFNGRTGLFPKHYVKLLQRFQGLTLLSIS